MTSRWLTGLTTAVLALAACTTETTFDGDPSAGRPAPTPTEAPATTTSTPSTSMAVTAPLQPAYRFPIEPLDPVSYVAAHHDYPATDMFAPCGSAVVSPVDGVISEASTADMWDPSVDDPASRGGLSVTVVGDDGVRYYGSHLGLVEPTVRPGARVSSGETLGTVGESGNAAGTGCHLHFGISPPCGLGDWDVRRGVVPPYDYLEDWRAGGNRTPAPEVEAWRAANAARCLG